MLEAASFSMDGIKAFGGGQGDQKYRGMALIRIRLEGPRIVEVQLTAAALGMGSRRHGLVITWYLGY